MPGVTNASCSGGSANLTQIECETWQEMYDQWSPFWSDTAECGGPLARQDPCNHCTGRMHCVGQGANNQPCGQNGLVCGGIQRIYWNAQNIRGTVPASIQYLTELTYLSLGDNPFLTGTLPAGMAQLTNLIDINLQNTGLTGPMPKFDFNQFFSGPGGTPTCDQGNQPWTPDGGWMCCGVGGSTQWECPLPPGAKRCTQGGSPPRHAVTCVGGPPSITPIEYVLGSAWSVALVAGLCAFGYRLWRACTIGPAATSRSHSPLAGDVYVVKSSEQSSAREAIYHLVQHEMNEPRPSTLWLVLFLLAFIFQVFSILWVGRAGFGRCNQDDKECLVRAFVAACASLAMLGAGCYTCKQYRKARQKIDRLEQGVGSSAIKLDDLGRFFLQSEFSSRARRGRGSSEFDRVMQTFYDDDKDAYRSDDTTESTVDFVGEEFDDSSVAFTAAQLRQATNEFHQRNKLDEGAFGAVYRGSIDGGTDVAIKILKLERQAKDQSSRGSSKYSGKQSFVREAKLLATYRHPNLVGLLGHFKGEDVMPQPALVFEFMTGGSLDERVIKVAPGQAALSVTERFAVASDTARGLAFLHGAGSDRDPLVHQDIKPANILLSSRASGDGRGHVVVAKLADFGLARIAPELARDSVSHVSTQTVAGTLPYMPPEFVMSRRVSTKTDAFAFGVVLMQLLTAKPPFHPVTRELLVDELDPVIEDPAGRLPGHLDSRAGAWPEEDAISLLRIASCCLEARPQRRSEVSELLPELDHLAGRDRGDHLDVV